MKIALFLSDENFLAFNATIYQVYIFRVEEKIIVAVECEKISLTNLHYLILWLLSKKIDEIYVKDIADEVKLALDRIYIKVKSLNEIKDHPLLRSFLL